MLKQAVISATLYATLSVPVSAQTVNVYDANNKLVGPIAGIDPDGNTVVILTLGGFKNFVALGFEGYSVNAQFYFPGPNCQNQPLA